MQAVAKGLLVGQLSRSPPAPGGCDTIGGVSERYLAALSLDGKLVVIVGGGRVAARRAPLLVRSGARVIVVSPRLHPGLTALAAEGQVVHVPRPFRAGDLDGAWYAMAATDAPEVNAAVVAEATRRRVFCVRADDGAAGTAATPASAREGDLQIGVIAAGDHRRSRQARDLVQRALRPLVRERLPDA